MRRRPAGGMRPRGGSHRPMRRWQRLATFDAHVLSEVYHDDGATLASVLTVAAVMLASSLGGLFWALLEGTPDLTGFVIESVVIGAAAATGMFFVWAGLVAVITGQTAFARSGRPTDSRALRATVRTLAFSTVPFGWSVFIFVPGVAFEVTLISMGLLLLSTTLATQTALGSSLGRALGANVVGFFLWLTVLGELMSFRDQFAPAPFLFELGGL